MTEEWEKGGRDKNEWKEGRGLKLAWEEGGMVEGVGRRREV